MTTLQTILTILISLGFIQVTAWFIYDRKWKKKQGVADREFKRMEIVNKDFLTIVR